MAMLTEKKKELKEQSAALRAMIIMTQLEGSKSDTIQRYNETKQLASKPYILWQLDFARVFKEKGGFDIVIGNEAVICGLTPEKACNFKEFAA